MIFIDTNYFLRYLLNDINDQHQEAKELFMSGSEGKFELMTSSLVLFEVYWVLGSVYSFNKQSIAESLSKLLKLSFIQFNERNIFISALVLFEKTNLDLEDCYNLFYAKEAKVTDFKTFDKKLQKEFKASK